MFGRLCIKRLFFVNISGLWPWVYSIDADDLWTEEKIKDSGYRALKKVAEKENEIIVFRREQVHDGEPQSDMLEM